eukprot:5128906-Pleurochrysis_carterae.AAC.1
MSHLIANTTTHVSRHVTAFNRNSVAQSKATYLNCAAPWRARRAELPGACSISTPASWLRGCDGRTTR